MLPAARCNNAGRNSRRVDRREEQRLIANRHVCTFRGFVFTAVVSLFCDRSDVSFPRVRRAGGGGFTARSPEIHLALFRVRFVRAKEPGPENPIVPPPPIPFWFARSDYFLRIYILCAFCFRTKKDASRDVRDHR